MVGMVLGMRWRGEVVGGVGFLESALEDSDCGSEAIEDADRLANDFAQT